MTGRSLFYPNWRRALAMWAAVTLVGIAGASPTHAARPSGPSTMSSLSCDVRADLLARTGTGELHVYHNVGGTGLGTFSSIHQVVGTGWGGYSEINLGDVDWDGCADLLARSSTGALHIYYNNPSGGGLSYFLSPPATVGTGWGGYSEIELGQLSWNQ